MIWLYIDFCRGMLVLFEIHGKFNVMYLGMIKIKRSRGEMRERERERDRVRDGERDFFMQLFQQW